MGSIRNATRLWNRNIVKAKRKAKSEELDLKKDKITRSNSLCSQPKLNHENKSN